MKLDMHCHTAEGSSDSKVGIKEYIERLKEQGYDGMLVTDHDSYDGYRYYRDNLKDEIKDFTVIKGIEYDTLEAGHFIVIMPDDVELKILEHKGLPLFTLEKIVHAYGGILGPAHPCGEPFLSIYSTGIFKRNRSITKKFDFIEGFNSGEDLEANDKAVEIAKEYNIPVTGGSDSHWSECCGYAQTIIEEDVHNADEMIAYIKANKATSISGRPYMGTLKARLGPWNKFLVYGFFPYNKVGAIKHKRKRKAELNNILWDLKDKKKEHEEHLSELEKRLKDRYKELEKTIDKIVNSEEFRSMLEHRHHAQVSTLEHCERVAAASEKLARKLRIRKIDRHAMLRGSLLHDFYLYDWHKEDNGEHKWHGYHHADKAIENAKECFGIGKKEQSIIHSHMWPLNITRVPRCKEAWIVCIADKYVSTVETLIYRKNRK